MPSFELKVGTVSWVNGYVSPIWFSGRAKMLEPEWVPKTYMGLKATSNPDPPSTISDFKAFQQDRHFRACTYCHIAVGVDENDRIEEFKVLDAFHDPGWTPPFRIREYPATGLAFDGDMWSYQWQKGEASPISVVFTRKRHPNSAIPAPAGETVLLNALIKFRAGKHTDDIAIKTVKSPFHVPWVWHETLVTYTRHRLKLYGRGSVFPSHAWYWDGDLKQRKLQVSDKFFPKTSLKCYHVPLGHKKGFQEICEPTDEIDVRQLKLYKVLSAGASAYRTQTPASDDAGHGGPVDKHPYTVGGGTLAGLEERV